MASLYSEFGRHEPGLAEKLAGLHWVLILLICETACFGFAVLYSAADGSMEPWAAKQMMRFAVALIPMLGAALLGIRYWFRAAYWAYAVALLLVVAVDLRGFVGMGARRWIDLGIIQLQPSSLMNVALVLALARYFHTLSNENVGRLRFLIPPALMVLVPAALVLKQPDLGTAIMLMLTGAVLLFIAGVRLRIFITMAAALAAAISVACWASAW
jgi:rod shape determining protein RodA